ncbi:hypothetical protein [Streptomyces sp. NPDC049813]|uniref:hypothetical protein n=1 Tax=Streptomyces sp. NPDC049813 TaxID=3365597 RepID=UPI003794EF07
MRTDTTPAGTGPGTDTDPGDGDGTRRRAGRRDLYAVAGAALLVLAAVVVGRHIEHTRHTLHVGWPPLYSNWLPHTGPGTPAALALALLTVAYGPRLAAALPWRPLLAVAWAGASAWILALALVDGWHRGIAVRLTTKYEYLRVIDRFQDIPGTLRTYTRHILIDSPDHWPAHTAGHPPAAPLTFVLLDRVGLGGGGWAGMWCILVGATAATAVLVAVRALASEELARRAAPFLVLAPAAVWMGASADAYFAAVAAWAVALLALAVTGRAVGWAAGAGLLFGLTCYLSYGLTLMAVVAVTVLFLGRHHVRRRPAALALLLLAGFAVVPTAFTLAGFNWWEAYRLLTTRYYQGAGGIRPYSYWVWANLACTVLIAGPATVAGLRRAVALLLPRPGADGPRLRLPRPDEPRTRLALLVTAALAALLIADLSGMSKAETERIWLPFTMWLLAAGAFLPRPRAWLAAQAVLALALNHLLLTGW